MFSVYDSPIYRITAPVRMIDPIPDELKAEFIVRNLSLNIGINTDPQVQRVVHVLDRGPKGQFFIEDTLPADQDVPLATSFEDLMVMMLEEWKYPEEVSDHQILSNLIDCMKRISRAQTAMRFGIFDATDAIKIDRTDPGTWACLRALYGKFTQLTFVATVTEDAEFSNEHPKCNVKLIQCVRPDLNEVENVSV